MCEFMTIFKKELMKWLPKHYSISDKSFIPDINLGFDILVVYARIHKKNDIRICFIKMTPDSSGLLIIPNAWKWDMDAFAMLLLTREEDMINIELDHNAKLFLLADPNGFEIQKVAAHIRQITRGVIEEIQTGKNPTKYQNQAIPFL